MLTDMVSSRNQKGRSKSPAKEKAPGATCIEGFFQNFLNRNLRVLLFSCILFPVIISLAKCSFR